MQENGATGANAQTLETRVDHIYYDEDMQLVGARLREVLKICLQSLPQDSTVVRAMIYAHAHYVQSIEVFDTLVEMYKVANKNEKQKYARECSCLFVCLFLI
jgi:hypothetical protein